MQVFGVAKKSEICGEIQPVEIGAAVGQAIRRDAHGVQGEDLRAFGKIGLELSNRALGVKRGDEHGACARSSEFCYRRGSVSKNGLADASHLLNIGAGDFDFGEAEEFVEGGGRSAGIVNGDGCVPRQGGDKSAAETGGAGMGQRLVKDVPSPNVIEGVYAQGHNEPVPERADRPLDITSCAIAASNCPSLP